MTLEKQVPQFNKDFKELENRFKEQVEKDNETCESAYIPNPVQLAAKVNYVLIGMEPSLGRWTKKGNTTEERIKIACEKIGQGLKNFAFSVEDFIVHFCIRRYLCSDLEKYYITDLSKGAMLTNKARKERNKRYKCWYPLLLEEIRLVSNEKAKIIGIGKAVYDFLDKSNFERESNRELLGIPHYSSQATGYRNRLIVGIEKESEFNTFRTQVSIKEIYSVAKDVVDKCHMSQELEKEIFNNLNKHKKLSNSKEKLVFTYKTRFEEINPKQHEG